MNYNDLYNIINCLICIVNKSATLHQLRYPLLPIYVRMCERNPIFSVTGRAGSLNTGREDRAHFPLPKEGRLPV